MALLIVSEKKYLRNTYTQKNNSLIYCMLHVQFSQNAYSAFTLIALFCYTR
jgi:hypothetical protein